ncbi:MAG: hypothetical protein IKQ77_11545, partial [Prevotella sp.]|nr:hypothetical protein [Prevotella sp.]
MKAEANSEVETVDDMAFQVVNNTSVNILADFQNFEGGSFCQPTMQCRLFSYDAETKNWTSCGSNTVTDVTFDVGERKTVTFSFDKLTPNTFYKAEMNKTVRAGKTSEITYEGTDTIALFKVLEPDLEVAIDGRKAVVTGSWNKDVFNQKKGGAEVCVYDFTATKGMNAQPMAVNPNALFIVAAPIPGTTNTVAEGICDNLVLTSEADFIPMEAFKARKATFAVERAKVGQWVDAVVPFAAAASQGMLVRQMIGLDGTALVVEQKRNVDAMSMVLCMIDHPEHNVFTGDNVDISALTETSVADGQLVGSTTALEVGANMMAFQIYNSRPYYRPTDEGTVLPPFATLMTITKRSGVRAFDTKLGDDRDYTALAETIAEAYDLMEKNPNEEGLPLLADAVEKAEGVFSMATEATVADVPAAIIDLEKAIDDFRSGVTAAIAPLSLPPSLKGSSIEYYNLHGQRLQSPEHGIVIVKQGNKVRKMLVK